MKVLHDRIIFQCIDCHLKYLSYLEAQLTLDIDEKNIGSGHTKYCQSPTINRVVVLNRLGTLTFEDKYLFSSVEVCSQQHRIKALRASASTYGEFRTKQVI